MLVDIDDRILLTTSNNDGLIHSSLIDFGDRPDVVEWLLAQGLYQDQRGNNTWTPLHVAAARGYYGTLAVLLNHGCDVNLGTIIDGNSTPLMEASSSGKLLCVIALLVHGAYISRKNELDGFTALEYAQLAGHRVIVELLQKFSASIRIKWVAIRKVFCRLSPLSVTGVPPVRAVLGF